MRWEEKEEERNTLDQLECKLKKLEIQKIHLGMLVEVVLRCRLPSLEYKFPEKKNVRCFRKCTHDW